MVGASGIAKNVQAHPPPGQQNPPTELRYFHRTAAMSRRGTSRSMWPARDGIEVSGIALSCHRGAAFTPLYHPPT